MGHNGQKVWQHTLSSYLGIEAHVQPHLVSGSLGHHQDVTWVMQKCVCGGGVRLILAPVSLRESCRNEYGADICPCVSLGRYGHRMSLEGSGEAVVRGL